MSNLALVVYGARETKALTVTTATAKALADFGFTAGHAGATRRITITAGANPVRITWSGVDPTASLGHYIAANGEKVLDGHANVQALRLISLTGDSVVTATIEY